MVWWCETNNRVVYTSVHYPKPCVLIQAILYTLHYIFYAIYSTLYILHYNTSTTIHLQYIYYNMYTITYKQFVENLKTNKKYKLTACNRYKCPVKGCPFVHSHEVEVLKKYRLMMRKIIDYNTYTERVHCNHLYKTVMCSYDDRCERYDTCEFLHTTEIKTINEYNQHIKIDAASTNKTRDCDVEVRSGLCLAHLKGLCVYRHIDEVECEQVCEDEVVECEVVCEEEEVCEPASTSTVWVDVVIGKKREATATIEDVSVVSGNAVEVHTLVTMKTQVNDVVIEEVRCNRAVEVHTQKVHHETVTNITRYESMNIWADEDSDDDVSSYSTASSTCSDIIPNSIHVEDKEGKMVLTIDPNSDAAALLRMLLEHKGNVLVYSDKLHSINIA